MRAHVIENGQSIGLIVNTIVVDSLSFAPGLIDADLRGGSIGDTWDGATIVRRPPSTPVAPLPSVQDQLDALRKAVLTADKVALQAVDAQLTARGNGKP